MTCKYCNSTNMHSQITKKDKKPVVIKTCLITFLLVWILTIGICMIFDPKFFAMGIYVGFLIAIPITIVAAVICLAKANKDVVVFVCNDCGNMTYVK